MNKTCPRCYEGVLRSWSELTDEEKEVAKRLPQSADNEASEREAGHRWCIRCWYEAVSGDTQI